MSIVIGLTGNIATGKSHIAEIFKGFGAAVQNSDVVAHELMENEAFEAIAKEFPAVVENGKINRQSLGREVFGNEAKLKKLEAILHPLVRQKNLEFIKANPGKIVVLEIPLLFETGADKICQYTVITHVSRETQHHRALAREGMTKEKLESILAKQEKIPLSEKLQRADFIIENEAGNNATAKVKEILKQIRK